MVGHKLGEFAPTRTFRGHLGRSDRSSGCSNHGVRATGKYIRMSPRKARMIFQGLRGMPVEKALTVLRFTPKPGAKHVAQGP